MTDFQKLLEALSQAGVRFVIVGGVAMVARGSGRTTVDLDICYARDPENLSRLADVLAPLHPTLRGAPKDLPFLWDDLTLRSGLNFTLDTDAGDIDLLGEVTGIGGYDQVVALSSELEIFDTTCRVLDLDGLERTKRAAGRVKDLLDLAEIARLKKLGG
jgi:hypothetical protein